jgi:acetyl-CoA carboxylase, biotin carboxylase subunit
MLRKVLIANRGEIALRVARACRELGIRTVAAYSTEDRGSAAVAYADESVCIGPGPARRSYLNLAAVVEAALRTGADALHPGYGFLSENPDLAEVCGRHGIAFVGPPPDVMERLGDKVAARRAMAAAGLPILPGSLEPLASGAEARDVAAEVGYPLILKAAAGGGGRGMRVVTDPAELVPAYEETAEAAQLLLGDGRIYVERYLATARHVEIQVLADAVGGVIDLGERDCSAQRRHQKLVEESPAPRLPAGLAGRMGELAVTGARAAGYVGAGTFEFLVGPGGDCFFMEVNCRIQTEHPVTELVTSIDLVQEQLRIAAGLPLRWRQEDVARRGAAIECRINAEDPDNGFVPTPGVLDQFVPPGGPFVRVDTHGYPGYRIPPTYDSLLAKVLAWAPTREEALARMDRALAEFRVHGEGVRTTAAFLRELIASPRFAAGEHDTTVVDHVLGSREGGDPAAETTKTTGG